MDDEERRSYVGEYICRADTQPYSSAKEVFKLVIKGIKPIGEYKVNDAMSYEAVFLES